MKKLSFVVFMCFIQGISAQRNEAVGIQPDVMLMKAAADHSKTGEIGVFVIAGREFTKISDRELNDKFDKGMKKHGVGIKLFIQRTDIRNGSSYDVFVDGAGVGDTVKFEDLKSVLKKAVNTFRKNRGLSINE